MPTSSVPGHANIVLQNDRSAARRKPLVVLAKDIIGQYFKLIRQGQRVAPGGRGAGCLMLAAPAVCCWCPLLCCLPDVMHSGFMG